MSTQMKPSQTNNLELKISSVRAQSAEIVKSANAVKKIADEVVTGAAAQVVSLDAAFERSNQLTTSLKETADQAISIISSAEETSTSINETAASIEQITINAGVLASSVNENAAAIEENAA